MTKLLLESFFPAKKIINFRGRLVSHETQEAGFKTYKKMGCTFGIFPFTNF
jgi:hypothetical protein